MQTDTDGYLFGDAKPDEQVSYQLVFYVRVFEVYSKCKYVGIAVFVKCRAWKGSIWRKNKTSIPIFPNAHRPLAKSLICC